MAATTYVVLEAEVGNDGSWFEVARVEANTPKKARELAAEKMNADEVDAGVYLRAVPARNWDGGGGEVKAETERRIRAT